MSETQTRRQAVPVGSRTMAAMGAPTQKAKNFGLTFKRLLTWFRPFRVQLFIVLILAILSTAFTIVSPKLVGNAIDLITSVLMLRLQGQDAAFDHPAINQVLWLLLGFYLMSSLFMFFTQWIMAAVSQRTVQTMRDATAAKLRRLPLSYYDGHSHGDILSRVTNDLDTISTTLQQSATQAITSVIQIIGFVIMMLTISPSLTLVVLATLPLYAITTFFIAKKSQPHFAAQQEHLGLLSSHVEEMFSGQVVVKAFGYEENSIEKFKTINDDFSHAYQRANFISGIIFPAMNFISNLGYVLISVVGGLWITSNRLSVGDIVAFIQYSRSFTQPIMQTASIANVLQSTIACAERVFEVLDEEEEEDPVLTRFTPPARNEQELRGAVKLNNISFRYEADSPLIEDLSLDVEPRHIVAIVGPTGAGKTTLVNLLMRFYELDSGTFSIDGQPAQSLTRSELRSRFGMVLQDTWLFGGSIYENIAFGRPDCTEEEVYAAATAAHADHFIRTLPDGYNTVLNEEVTNISQGQKQLLTIARAILANPDILILDEATSNVDTRTEMQIQKAMKKLMKNRTSFVIAHRLSTIQDAENILVMDKGKIIEQGTHGDLMAQKGFYYDLFISQFSGVETAEAS
ncbi:MAG: ATP-binding cassette domain-containing protein [Pseudomonadales bacterium]|nr:ATP-binding cassette domain-containing protein [Pseudomonadales bacterium]